MKNVLSIINNEPRYSDGDIYYYHGDHLGSATWITDATGAPIQYIQYLPTGEIWQNIIAGNYNERFKFTGKEHDEESGYDYFGARYYWSLGGIWTAIDPLADKYPSNNPYMYCSGNPLKYVDPDGRDIYNFDENGNYMGKVQQDGAHYGMMMHGGKSISFSFADPVNDPQAIDNGHIDKLHFVSNAEVMQILTESGVFNPKNQENKYSFIKNESNASNIKGEGRMDYVVTGIFRGTSIVNYSNYLFVTNNQGEYSAHNTYNFGNYLWGAGVSALGIPYLMAWLGSNINNFLFDTLSKWHMDSKDDQYSIKQGFIWQQNRK